MNKGQQKKWMLVRIEEGYEVYGLVSAPIDQPPEEYFYYIDLLDQLRLEARIEQFSIDTVTFGKQLIESINEAKKELLDEQIEHLEYVTKCIIDEPNSYALKYLYSLRAKMFGANVK